MRFRFRMERILDFMRLREKAKKMEVAFAVQTIENLEKKKREREETIRSVLKSSVESLGLNSNYVPYHLSKISADTKEIRQIEESIGTAKEDLEQKKYELGRLSMKRKAIENLREKRKQEFRTSENRKEQKRHDELYRLVKGKGI